MLARPISKINTKRLIATFLILAIVLSMSGLIVPIAADISQGNNVSWQSQDQTTQNSYDWTNQGWQFGPYPSFSIILPNGTEITNDNYIPLNQPFTVRIDVQKSVFVGNATLGQAGLTWNSDLRSDNGTITGHAECKLMYVNIMQQGNWNQTNVWNINSNINNQTVYTDSRSTTAIPAAKWFLPIQLPTKQHNRNRYGLENPNCRCIQQFHAYRTLLG